MSSWILDQFVELGRNDVEEQGLSNSLWEAPTDVRQGTRRRHSGDAVADAHPPFPGDVDRQPYLESGRGDADGGGLLDDGVAHRFTPADRAGPVVDCSADRVFVLMGRREIGRASCRERVCQYV